MSIPGRAKNTDAIEAMKRDPQAYFAEQTRPSRVNWKLLAKHMAAERRREKRQARWRGIKGALGLGPRASTYYRRKAEQ